MEIHLPEEDAKLGLPSSGVVWIHQLYVSYALQQHGFGAAAMDQVEVTAREEIFKGRMLVLDTIQEEMQMSPEGKKHLYAERGVPIPRVSGFALSQQDVSNRSIRYQHRAGMRVEGMRY